MLGRHLQVAIFISNSLDQQTFFHLIGNQRWPGVPALAPTLLRVESEPPFDFLFGAVAFETAFHQKWPYFALEKVHARMIRSRHR